MYYVLGIVAWTLVCYATLGTFDSILFGIGSSVVVSVIIKAANR